MPKIIQKTSWQIQDTDSFNPSVLYMFKRKMSISGNANYHCHDFPSLIYIISGNCVYNIDNVYHEVKKGDIVILNPGVYHRKMSKISDDGIEFHAGFTNIYFEGLKRNQVIGDKDKPVFTPRGKYEQEFNLCISNIIADQEKNEPFKEIMQKALFMRLFAVLLNALSSTTSSGIVPDGGNLTETEDFSAASVSLNTRLSSEFRNLPVSGNSGDDKNLSGVGARHFHKENDVEPRHFHKENDISEAGSLSVAKNSFEAKNLHESWDLSEAEFLPESDNPQYQSSISGTGDITEMDLSESEDIISSEFIIDTYEKSGMVNSIITYFNEHYQDQISLGQIAKNMYLSAVYISKIFKEELGDSPINYLIRVRLEKARELLESGKYTVKSAARSVGYKDAYHFSRLYKKHMGCSPSTHCKKL